MEVGKLVILFAVVTVMALASLASSEPQKNERERNEDERTDHEHVCKKEVCKERASLITKYINMSADPCEDFYSYVCESWSRNPISFNVFTMLRWKFVDALMRILKQAEIVYNNQTVVNKVAVLYNACLAVPKEEDERTDLSEIMDTYGLAEWPIISGDNSSGANFENVTEVLLKVGMEPVVQFYVEKTRRNSSTHGIELYALGLKSRIDGDKLNKSVMFLNRSLQDSDVKKLNASLTAFHQQWTNFIANSSQHFRIPATPTTMTLGALEENTTLPLRILLNIEFNKANIVLNDDEFVDVYTWEGYKIVDKFLEASSPVDLFNYIGYQFVLAWGERTFLRSRNPKVSSSQCVELVHNAMKEVTSYLYASEKFTPAAKSQVEEIVRRVKEVFNNSLQTATWLDPVNKIKAVEKLKKITAKVGYPPWLLNMTALEYLYRYVPILNQSTSFLKMMHVTIENNDRRMMEKLRQPYNKDSNWYFSLSAVTSFYSASSNEFVCPLGGLQSPFYEYGLPWSLNMGGIGSVIAHEMTHAFAGTVSHYDGDGIPQQIQTNDEYKARTECFVQQYGNITDEETKIKINGTQTLDENIADSSGLELAYEVYEKMIMEECHNTTTSLDTLPDVSGPKLFFITNAMLWCSAIKPEYLKYQMPYMRYSPNKYRVNLSMRNLPAFAAAFNCSSESGMLKDSTDKCSLWRPIRSTEGPKKK